jgi:hypothetical protein
MITRRRLFPLNHQYKPCLLILKFLIRTLVNRGIN